MNRAFLLRQRFGDDVFVEAVGLSYPTAQIYSFDGPFEIPFGDIDKKLRWGRLGIVDAIDDAKRVHDESLTLRKKAIDSCAAT